MDKIDKEFATSVYYGKPSLTEEALKKELEDDLIYRTFKRKGYILSRQFSFITYATFSEDIKSILDERYHGKKTEEEREQSLTMLKIVEDHFNSIANNPIKVGFIARNDNECALYNKNRYTYDQINQILLEEYRT